MSHAGIVKNTPTDGDLYSAELETACCVTFCKNVFHHSSYL